MKQKAFVDAELQQINFLDERFYHAGQDENGKDKYYPSVTHILNLYPKGAAFTQWLKDVGQSATLIADRAKEAGSKVHNGIEQILNGLPVSWGDSGENYSLEEWQGLNRYMDFHKVTQVEPMLIEGNVYSHKYRYAGTSDLICKIGEETWLIDHKFGNAIYPTYFMQLIAYKVAAEEMNPNLKIDRVGVLHLKAKTRTAKADVEKGIYQGVGWQLVDPMHNSSVKEQAKLHKADPYEVVWENFVRIMGIYYYETPDPKPKNMVLPSILTLDQAPDTGVKSDPVDEVQPLSLMEMFEADREKFMNLS